MIITGREILDYLYKVNDVGLLAIEYIVRTNTPSEITFGKKIDQVHVDAVLHCDFMGNHSLYFFSRITTEKEALVIADVLNQFGAFLNSVFEIVDKIPVRSNTLTAAKDRDGKWIVEGDTIVFDPPTPETHKGLSGKIRVLYDNAAMVDMENESIAMLHYPAIVFVGTVPQEKS